MMLYKEKLSKKTELLIHLLFWAVSAYFTFVGNPGSATFNAPDFFYVTYMIVFASTFYFHYLASMPWVFKSFHWKRLGIGVLFSYLLFTSLRWIIEQYLSGILFHKVNYINPSFTNYMIDNLRYSIMPIVFSSFLWFAIYFTRLLEYNKIILEENKNTEIKFLKAQINPHFIFNTLNNIYSMVYFKSDLSLPAIEKLSQIMRFTTYESQKERIKLSDEINYIKAYIELEQLRYKESAFVDLDVKTDNENTEIPPYILSPFVENALKHGLASNEHPIEITLTAAKGYIVFIVRNEVGTQKKDKLGGIGLENLKKRLEIHYPGMHQLELTTGNNRFTAKLEIHLK